MNFPTVWLSDALSWMTAAGRLHPKQKRGTSSIYFGMHFQEFFLMLLLASITGEPRKRCKSSSASSNDRRIMTKKEAEAEDHLCISTESVV